jgi:hypothetical protein
VPAAVRAERRAWLILWLAFATFCALTVAAFKFAVDYVSTAEVNQNAGVSVVRGQVILTLPGSAERTLLGNRSDLSVGTVLWLDRNTSAELQLFDDSKLKLLGGATLELSRMEVGRFRNQHAVALTQTSGPVRYETAGPIDVRVPSALVHLTAQGDYTIWQDDNDVWRVMVYHGEARAASTGSGLSATATEGERVDINAKGLLSTSMRLPIPFLVNAGFMVHEQGWQAIDGPDNPLLDVNGIREWVSGPESSTALRVLRRSVRSEHGETGLAQTLDRNVSGFRHLWLRAWVRVDYADLSGGGTFGSEYPLMFRIKYEGPSEGSYYPWYVGMFYANPENRPILPNTAELWPQGEWKLFQTDLMETEASRTPYRLMEFAVLGQGHSYDARVGSISLVGE